MLLGSEFSLLIDLFVLIFSGLLLCFLMSMSAINYNRISDLAVRPVGVLSQCGVILPSFAYSAFPLVKSSGYLSLCYAAPCGHPATGLAQFCALLGGCICLLAFICSSYSSVLLQALPWLMPFVVVSIPFFPSVCPPINLLVLLSVSAFCPSVRISSWFCFLFKISLDSVSSAI